jgi:hypothetical protein
MRVSFSLHLAGGYTVDGRARPLALTLEGQVPISRDEVPPMAALAGRVDADAIARGQAAEGSLALGRTLHYDLSFPGDDGRTWRLTAAQRLTTRGKPSAFTVARGTLRRGPDVSLPVELRFDPRGDLRRLLASLSLRR